MTRSSVCLDFQNAVVRRVDNALGLLLELPLSDDNTAAAQTTEEGVAAAKGKKAQKKKGGGGHGAVSAAAAAVAGYVHISNASDDRIDKLDKVRW
jgi:hypothetical protein